MKICLTCEGISETDLLACSTCGTRLLATDAVHYPLRRGEEDSTHPLLGARIDGKFRVVNVLGKGGMGTVFRAIHEVSLVPVALKLLHPRYGLRRAYRDAFLAEARKAGRVIHDHCARVLDVGEAEDGTLYLAMELAEGETLQEWIQGPDRPPPAAVVDVLIQIARALVAAHAVGLVHRDLSTRNVMVTSRDEQPFVKILDFGIAKAAAIVARSGAVEPASASGPTGFANPAFSAPEHLEGKAVDARADLYSLGVVAYQALSGQLPVDAEDARATARATMEGNLRPLPPVPGVPGRLRRLVEGLLQRDPERRPGSAQEVLAELERIRRPQGILLGRVALLLMLGAVLTLALTRDREEPPEVFLRKALGNPLELTAQTPDAEYPTTYLRSAQLHQLRFQFSGFDPTQLQVEIYQDNGDLEDQIELRLDPQTIRPAGPEAGYFTISTLQPEWNELLPRLKNYPGRLNLGFSVGRGVLAYARVFVDDDEPELTVETANGDGPFDGVLRGDTRIEYTADDAGGVKRVGLLIQFAPASGAEREPVVHELSAEGGVLVPQEDEDLMALFPGIENRGAGTLQLFAEDRAGNRRELPAIGFTRFDLAAPDIESVTSPAGDAEVPYVVSDAVAEAFVQIKLSAAESGLRVIVVGPEKLERPPYEPRQVGGTLSLQLQPVGEPREGDQAFPNGQYQFLLLDGAGNRSEMIQYLTFRSLQINAVLDRYAQASNGPGRVAILEDEVVTDGEPIALAFSCNELYTPDTATVEHVTGDPVEGAADKVTMTDTRPGGATIGVKNLEAGVYRLELRLRAKAADSAQTAPTVVYDLRILPKAVRLRLRGTAARFLPAVEEAQLLRVRSAGDGVTMLEQGEAWSLVPDDSRLLRGSIWVGDDQPVAMPLAERSDPKDAFLPPIALRNGRNVIALDLRDVLERPVVVEAEPVPAEKVVDGRRLPVIVAFDYHAEAPDPVGEILVEHGQMAELTVSCRLPFRQEDLDAILLELSDGKLNPVAVLEGTDGGSQLSFALPFAALVRAAELEHLSKDDYASAHTEHFPAELITPAGRYVLELDVRTQRSLLVPVRLGEWATAAPAVAAKVVELELDLVPLLSPGEFVDPVPVPGTAPGRAAYRLRPAIDVRNVDDIYLQDRELTRAQYAGLVAAFLELPEENWPPLSELVHHDDPQGKERLTEQELVPARDRAQARVWAQRVADDPTRPVTGVDFFQAYTISRICGFLVAGDPELFRLPLGFELELAALGPGPAPTDRDGLRLNAVAGAAAPVSLGGFEAAKDRWREPLRPPTAAECADVVGDAVTVGGAIVHGLDFGVREWVLDLAYDRRLSGEMTLREWLSDHAVHLQHIAEFAAGAKVPPGDLALSLTTFGVVRGLAFGERGGLIDGWTGDSLSQPQHEPIPHVLPGVVRAENVPRDGRDLSGGGMLDPRLERIGFRLAGGSAFVAWVRQR